MKKYGAYLRNGQRRITDPLCTELVAHDVHDPAVLEQYHVTRGSIAQEEVDRLVQEAMECRRLGSANELPIRIARTPRYLQQR